MKEKEIHWEDLKRLIQEKSETLSPMLEEKMGKERQLLENIHQRKSEIMSLYEKGKQIRDDGVYRYYHHSAKVYFDMQEYTGELVAFFKSLNVWDERQKLNEDFIRIITPGIGKKFEKEFNFRWDKETRPLVEAFFHAFHMLEMIVEYGLEKVEPSRAIEAGWGSVLYLYNLR